MTRRRWIADEFTSTHACITGKHAEHLIRVLRARLGQEFDISAGESLRRGVISSIADQRVEFELAEEIAARSTPEITLLLAIFKFDRMEWAIEKCTELGVARIVPLITARSEPHLVAASAKRVVRWQRIAHQASEQSRRISPPEISQPAKVQAAVQSSGGTSILLNEAEGQASLRDVLASHLSEGILLAVGPEGGWTEKELQIFIEAGWRSASLGPTILRAETAAIAATAAVISLL
jgi:16S rRNA (uracil1498-N3)-methyltransferase